MPGGGATIIVILCHPDDAAALWLHAAWHSAAAFELVTVEQVVFSRRIVHRLDNAGESRRIRLVDGRVLRAEAITGLVNRVRYLPTQHFGAANPDRTYATAELSAFMLAWLNGGRGACSIPRDRFPGGGFDRTVMHFAATAGLPTAPWKATPSHRANRPACHRPTTIVLDGRLFGPIVPRSLQDGCCRLAALLGVPLLQVRSTGRLARLAFRRRGRTSSIFRRGTAPLAAAIAKAFAA